MDRFDQARGCPKCGNAGAATSFWHHAAGDERCKLEAAEHMHRECNQCAYAWAEAPLS